MNGYQQPYIAELDANSYNNLTELEHIYERPEMYIGSNQAVTANYIVCMYNEQIQRYGFQPIYTWMVPGLLHLLNELFYNANDAMKGAKKHNLGNDMISVTFDQYSFTITNTGLGIPVEQKYYEAIKQTQWIPENIFGEFRSSSNFGKRNQGSTKIGENGFGSKLNNAFGLQFDIDIGDGYKNNLRLTKTWKNCMTISEPSKIEPYRGASYVTVRYCPKFDMFRDVNGQPLTTWPPGMEYFINRLAADVSRSTELPISVNGQIIDFTRLEHFHAALFPQVTNKIELINHKTQHGMYDILALDTPGAGITMSYVNGKETRMHGTHVTAIRKSLAERLVEIINRKFGIKGKLDETNQKKKNNKSATTKKNASAPSANQEKKVISGRNLNMAYIEVNITLVIFYHTTVVGMGAQTKDQYGAEVGDTTLPLKALEPMAEWQALEAIRSFIYDIDHRLLAKMNGKKATTVRLNAKEEEANWAGKAKSHMCELYLVEGNSAKGMWEMQNAFIPNARDTRGVLPGRGKFINAMKADIEKVAANKYLNRLMQMLGLVHGTNYGIPENRAKLRYGCVVLMNDADCDGSHILVLELAFFARFFPELLYCNDFFFFERTPIIRCTQGKFYTYPTFRRALNANYRMTNIRYMKGLGSSGREDVENDMATRHVIQFICDQDAPRMLTMVMDKQRDGESRTKITDARKQWQLMPREEIDLEEVRQETITTFIHYEFISYAQVCLPRGIPSLDGVNHCRMKALYYMFLRWNNYTGRWQDIKKQIKVDQFASGAMERLNYHHGPVSIIDAVVRMGQNFIGGPNNLPLVHAWGQFGTRNDHDPAAARYLFMSPSPMLRFLYPQADVPLIDRMRIMEDGDIIEPLAMLGIIPLSMVNGASGMAVGWSTDILSFNPQHVIEWYMERIQQDMIKGLAQAELATWPVPPEIVDLTQCATQGLPKPPNPWYRGFTGQNMIVYSQGSGAATTGGSGNNPKQLYQVDTRTDMTEDMYNAKWHKSADVLGSDNVGLAVGPHYQMISAGVFEYNYNTRQVHVTEIPIGRYIDQYRQWLRIEEEEKRISHLHDNSDDQFVEFTFTWLHPTQHPSYENLRLVRRFGMSNMHLLRPINVKFSKQDLTIPLKHEFGKKKADKETAETEQELPIGEVAEDTGIHGVGKFMPIHFPTILHLLEYYYHWRLPFFYYRKVLQLSLIQNRIHQLNYLYKLIYSTAYGILQTTNYNPETKKSRPRPEREMIADIEALGIPKEYYRHPRYMVKNISEEKVARIAREIQEEQAAYDKLLATPHHQLWLDDLIALRAAYLEYEPKLALSNHKTKKRR